MIIENLCILLGWCSAINAVVLLVWFLAFVLARNLIFIIHTRWFKLSDERFDEIHYTIMGYYKIAWLFFNLLPYLVLRFAQFNQ
ncbi:MAG: hypothetical protein VYD34_02630 [Verrucomicrobiota bacterium]|nr:hypothetical protein [Verrucomicrobiota bacterium]